MERSPAKKCADEANLLRAFLRKVKPPIRKRIRLLCLTWELETWLIAEDRAVREHLSKPAHPCSYSAPKDLNKVDDPKSHLDKVFTGFRGKSRRYEDRIEAIQLVQKWPDINRVKKVPSFKRFATLLTGSGTPALHQCGAACNNLAHQAARMGH